VYGELEEYEEYDSDELYGEESLERRLTRLRREVEEVKNEIAAREEEADLEGVRDEGVEEEEGEVDEEIEDENMFLRLGINDLSDALEGLQTVPVEERGAQAKLAKKLATSLSVPTATPGQAVSIEATVPKVPETEVTSPAISKKN
jgi:nuclear migration protein JNM1